MPLKTLFLNPPSFENFDGGASSRWPATARSSPTGTRSGWPIRRECWRVRACWMRLRTTSRRRKPSRSAKEYEFLVLFTCTPGWQGDQKLAEAIKTANPSIRLRLSGRR